MKKVLTLLLVIMLIILSSCGRSNNPSTQPTTDEPSTTITTPSDDNPTTLTEEDRTANMTLALKIVNTLVDVFWMENDSVKALKMLAKDGLTIELHQYGDFEQTSSLGTTIVSNDTLIDVGPGDIVL